MSESHANDVMGIETISDTVAGSPSEPAINPLDVVMVVHNALPSTILTLMHLMQFTPVPVRVTIVDSASAAPVRLALDRLLGFGRGWHRYVRSDENIGPFKAWNAALTTLPEQMPMSDEMRATFGVAGFEHEGACDVRDEPRWVLLLNSDHLLMPGWFDAMLPAMRSSRFAWLSPSFVEGWTPADTAGACIPLRKLDAPVQVAPVFCSSCALIRWPMLDTEVGRFDERFFLLYGDDDYKTRLDRAGMRYGTVVEARSHHLGMQTRQLVGVSAMAEYERADMAAFVEKYQDDPAVLAQHPAIEQLLASPDEVFESRVRANMERWRMKL